MVRRQVWPYPPLPLPYRLLPRKMSPQTPSFLGAQETPSQTYLPSPLAYGWKQVTPVHALTCRLLPRQKNSNWATCNEAYPRQLTIAAGIPAPTRALEHTRRPAAPPLAASNPRPLVSGS